MDKSLILQACRTLTQHLLFILVDPLQNKILSKSITKTNTRKLVPNKIFDETALLQTMNLFIYYSTNLICVRLLMLILSLQGGLAIH